jgi:hypothetical protein
MVRRLYHILHPHFLSFRTSHGEPHSSTRDTQLDPTSSAKIPFTSSIPDRLETPSLIVLDVHALRSLARVRRIGNMALLPLIIIGQLALEVQRVVDRGKAELNVVSLLTN